SVRKIPNTPTPSGYDVAEAKDGIKYALEKMSDEEKDVVKMRFYEDKTIKDIAKCKNCSPQKIYQMISKLKRLAPT
ncbi:MAG: hypothetical protein H8E32_00235, partial [Nitrospinae bacterium]|nr:hypothetical protein [Nitrospinota bacterium]